MWILELSLLLVSKHSFWLPPWLELFQDVYCSDKYFPLPECQKCDQDLWMFVFKLYKARCKSRPLSVWFIFKFHRSIANIWDFVSLGFCNGICMSDFFTDISSFCLFLPHFAFHPKCWTITVGQTRGFLATIIKFKSTRWWTKWFLTRQLWSNC